MTTGKFMRSPEPEITYEVGDKVEVNCDHEKNGQRVRGWLRGTVVQVDDKNVAVQFRTNIYLTDGWMVPDQIFGSRLIQLMFVRSNRNPEPRDTRY